MAGGVTYSRGVADEPALFDLSGGREPRHVVDHGRFERIDLALVRDILAATVGAGEDLRAVSFENPIVATGSVPDARMSGRTIAA